MILQVIRPSRSWKPTGTYLDRRDAAMRGRSSTSIRSCILDSQTSLVARTEDGRRGMMMYKS